MAAYVDWEFYANEYSGIVLSEADFPRLAKRASEEIDYMTFNRAQCAEGARLTAVKMATCAVAETLHTIEQSGGVTAAGITSERVGGHSVTYADASKTTHDRGVLMLNAACRHLEWTGLLYAGID